MEILINRKELVSRLDVFLGLIENKNNSGVGVTNHYQLDTNILIKCSLENKNINLIGQNSKSQVTIVTVLDADVKKEGSILVDPHILRQVLNQIELDGDDVRIFTDKSFLILNKKTGNLKVKYSDYGATPNFPKTVKLLLSINISLFKEGLASCMVFNELDNTMSVLNNLCLYSSNQGKDINFCSTSKTVSNLFTIFNLESNLDEDSQVLLNKNLLGFVSRLISSSDDGFLEIYMTDNNKIVFLFEKYYMLGTVISGNYPNLSFLFTDDYPNNISLSKDSIIDILKEISIVCKKNAEVVSFDFNENIFDISCKNRYFEDNKTIYLSKSSPENINFKFNYLKLLEIFNSFNKKDNDFIFHWKDNSSPVLVTLPDKKIDGFNTSKKHVIVPSS